MIGKYFGDSCFGFVFSQFELGVLKIENCVVKCFVLFDIFDCFIDCVFDYVDVLNVDNVVFLGELLYQLDEVLIFFGIEQC